MKKYAYSHDTGLFVLRLLLAGLFLFHVLAKFNAPEMMVNFIGGAPHILGLTFLPISAWFYLAIVGEICIAVGFIFGVCTRFTSIVLWIIMFFAMVSKKRAFPAIELDLVLAVLGLVLFIAGPGRFSLAKHHRENAHLADTAHLRAKK